MIVVQSLKEGGETRPKEKKDWLWVVKGSDLLVVGKRESEAMVR